MVHRGVSTSTRLCSKQCLTAHSVRRYASTRRCGSLRFLDITANTLTRDATSASGSGSNVRVLLPEHASKHDIRHLLPHIPTGAAFSPGADHQLAGSW